ncbi:hypothetical protein K461DRAFT_307102 [Myriangium duriaei CBS 260.36]|uniref:NACHT domain-containing protein n=1 Tax=Myriangium duriaei CBS 260.36 TaxID=1168546 RepID=A0A9P4MG14_9PEZI|nr:hypothetical protein K461DRAFT_307102 [Myriangium duriaei CBS 260.36]
MQAYQNGSYRRTILEMFADQYHVPVPSLLNQSIGNITASNSRLQVEYFVNNSQDPDSDIRLLDDAKEAAHDALASQENHGCLPGTRKGVLQEVMTWILGDKESCILWLNGVAGSGKSTLARTICKDLKTMGMLGASFFFSHAHKDTSNATMFFTTIAKQLAVNHPSLLRDKISQIVRTRPDIALKAFPEQWETLVAAPLCACDAGSEARTIVIPVDALDECEAGQVGALLSQLIRSKDISNVRLRFIITSRPEPIIRNKFQRSDGLYSSLVLEEVPRETVDADISAYVWHELSSIKKSQDWILDDWPSAEIVKEIVNLSAGLFIYAATIC